MKTKIYTRKRGNKRRKNILYYPISILFFIFLLICIASMIITFSVFVKDVNTINQYFMDLYENIKDVFGTVNSEHIAQAKVVEQVYKNARTFDVLSFLYMFVSSILIGLMIYFYNEINEVKRLAEWTKESIESFQMSARNYEGIVALSEINNNAFEINNLLDTIESMCTLQSEVARDRIDDYKPRLRAKLYESANLLEKLCLEPADNIRFSLNQMDSLTELFYTFPGRIESIMAMWDGIILNSTQREFLGYIIRCKKSLEVLIQRINEGT